MTGAGPADGRDRRRGWASVVVLGVAVLITAATSSEQIHLDDRVDGEAFLLTPDTATVTVPVTFHATPESFVDDPSVWFEVAHQVSWTDGDRTRKELEIELVRRDPLGGDPFAGISPTRCSGATCTTSCGGRRDCADRYDLVFRWPEDVEAGSARVEWWAEAALRWDTGWFSSSEPPDGAEIWVEVGDPQGGSTPPELLASWETSLDLDASVAQEAVTVRTHGALDGGELALEAQFDADMLRVAMRRGPGGGTGPGDLPAGSSTPLSVPGACQAGPCTFTIETLAQFVSVPVDRSADVRWGLTSTTPMSVEVATGPVEVAQAAGRGGPVRIRLDEGEEVELRFLVTIPAAALPVGEWPRYLPGSPEDPPGSAEVEPAEPNQPGSEVTAADVRAAAGPIVELRLRPFLDADGLDADAEPSLRIQATTRQVSPDGGQPWPAASWVERRRPVEWDSWRTPLPNGCRPDEMCELGVTVVVSALDRGTRRGGGPVRFDLETEAAVLLPWTGLPPEGVEPIVEIVRAPS